MKKFLSMILAACFAASAVLMAACTSGNSGTTSTGSESVSSSEVEFDGWTPENILLRPVEKDDIRIGSYVSFADTAKGWSGRDQVERLYYAGLNFMPMICTLPKAGMLTETEKTYISRDLTDSKWWGKIDELMQEYNMVYYFSELSGLANDHESSTRRDSMANSDAVADARNIIPNLKNCVGVKLVDEPKPDAFEEFAKWARYYSRITDADGNVLGLDALVNHIGSYDYMAEWVNKAGSGVNIISFDAYPFLNGGINYATLTLMDQVRKLANSKNMRVAMYPQSCAWAGARMPNLKEIIWHFNTNLALGATQFTYFNYTMYPNEGCYDAIFAIDGSVLHQDILDGLTEFHKEIRALDANVRLTDFKVTESYMTSAQIGIAMLPATGFIINREGLGSTDLLITKFQPNDYESSVSYINIVNNSFENPMYDQEFLLDDNAEYDYLEMYNYKTGKFEPLDVVNNSFMLSLEASEAAFIKVVYEY